jgi:hypothetical protein
MDGGPLGPTENVNVAITALVSRFCHSRKYEVLGVVGTWKVQPPGGVAVG